MLRRAKQRRRGLGSAFIGAILAHAAGLTATAEQWPSWGEGRPLCRGGYSSRAGGVQAAIPIARGGTLGGLGSE